MRERAFFSSRVESVRFLQRSKDWIGGFLNSNTETLPNGGRALIAGGRAQFVEPAREFAVSDGMGPLDPEDKVESPEAKFNDHLEASVRPLDGELLDKLRVAFGDQGVIGQDQSGNATVKWAL